MLVLDFQVLITYLPIGKLKYSKLSLMQIEDKIWKP